jgi:hypothetical protein
LSISTDAQVRFSLLQKDWMSCPVGGVVARLWGKEIQDRERRKDRARIRAGGQPAARRGSNVRRKIARHWMTVDILFGDDSRRAIG